MKSLIVIATAFFLITSCKESDKEKPVDVAPETTQATTPEPAETNQAGKSFDISTVPVSDKEMGQFPFFGVPDGMRYQVEEDKTFHRTYFGINGKLVPLEGRTFAAFVFSPNNSSSDFEPLTFEKNYDNLITGVGGVLVSNQKIDKEEIDRVGREELSKYHSVADIYNEAVKTYVIRRADAEIWVQLSFNSASGNIVVVQKGDMKQTASIISATEIKKQLDADGKAVLYIQFDTDKATLKPEGEKAVAEIAKLLTAEKDLKLAINGYTDNTGADARNLTLSKDRAASVLKAITGAGIQSTRLSSDGFGSASPIGDNASEEGKANNRRVELVKR